jgi:hypothetical protein
VFVAAAAGGSVLVLDAAGVALAVESFVGWAAKIHCCYSGPEAAHVERCDSTHFFNWRTAPACAGFVGRACIMRKGGSCSDLCIWLCMAAARSAHSSHKLAAVILEMLHAGFTSAPHTPIFKHIAHYYMAKGQ